MKFVALLSGGKDSCFNIIKCIENKHELVALANLMPPDSDVEEMNSFMYQSAAHNTIPQMADCFGVPLYRQEIRGSAVVQSLDYKKEETDEVEDLFLLLQKVVDAHPGIRGVACGAIISNYQRLRVEDVCSRLGLTPLTYLWMRDRKELLDDIIETGVVAVLVKVAGAGLDPHKHLGKTLKEMRPILHRLHDRFGLDYCGEGGEYETLVLDCSAFKKKLILMETIILLDAEDCSVGNLKILGCSVEEKVPVSGVFVPHDSEDLEPNIQLQEDNCKLTSSLRHILELSSALNTNISNQQKMACNTACGSHCDPGSYFTVSLPEQVPVPTCPNGAQSDGSSDNDYGYRNNSNSDCSIDDVSDGSLFTGQSTCNGRSDFRCLHGKDGVGQTSLKRSIVRTASALLSSTHPTSKNELSRGTTEAVAQMRLIMLQLKEAIVSSSECDIKDACFIHLYISDISLFHAVNDEYCTWFDRNPPSRSCVAVSPLFTNLATKLLRDKIFIFVHSIHFATLIRLPLFFPPWLLSKVPLPPGIFVAADAVFLKGSYRTIQLGRSSRRQVGALLLFTHDSSLYFRSVQDLFCLVCES